MACRAKWVPFLAAVLLASCARPAPSNPAVGPGPGADPTRMAIYEATLRHLAGSDSGGSWKTVLINEEICRDASIATKRSDCQDRFTAEEQAELVTRLSDLDGEVGFVRGGEVAGVVDDIFEGRTDGSVLLRVGPIDREGGKTSVGGSYYCGGLCASGGVWLLEPEGHRWIVSGPDSDHGVWIS